MQHGNATKPATAQSPKAIATGAGQQANTDAEALRAYDLANLAHVEAKAAKHRAEEAEARALATALRVNPLICAGDRLILAKYAEDDAERHAGLAEKVEQRLSDLRLAVQPPASIDPMAVIVITVQRDRIQQTARLVMGGTRTISRSWDRAGRDSWRSRDPEWSTHENRVGVELVEFMDALSLPDRVAAMLPRPAAQRVAPKMPEVANA